MYLAVLVSTDKNGNWNHFFLYLGLLQYRVLMSYEFIISLCRYGSVRLFHKNHTDHVLIVVYLYKYKKHCDGGAVFNGQCYGRGLDIAIIKECMKWTESQ